MCNCPLRRYRGTLGDHGKWTILRFDDAKSLQAVKKGVKSIWDNGELVLGYGEFMENNKNLVPTRYTMDWWASDLLEFISNQDEADELAGLLGVNSNDLPNGFPAY